MSDTEIDSSDEETDDFEEVEDIIDDDDDLDDYKPQLPENGIDITVKAADINFKRKRNAKDKDAERRQRINRAKKRLQLNLHKGSFLLSFTRLTYMNNVTRSLEIKAISMSHLAAYCGNDLQVSTVNLTFIKSFVDWFKKYVKYVREFDGEITEKQRLRKCLLTKKARTTTEYLLAFASVIKSISNQTLGVRLCYPINPIPLKVKGIVLSEKQLARRKSTETKDNKAKKAKKEKPPSKIEKLKNGPATRSKKRKVLSSDSSDVEVQPKPKASTSKAKPNAKSKETPVKIEAWLEIYMDSDKKWISVEPFNCIIDKPRDIESLVTPFAYVVAVDQSGHVKDVTRRYASEYMSNSFRQMRLKDGWIEQTLALFRTKFVSAREVEEDRQLEVNLSQKPFPTSIGDFKAHPLYGLKRHLLKYEVIYPPDAPTLGFFRGEAIYPRDCVRDVHTREKWIKEARVVRIGETPYKIAAARPKWDKHSGQRIVGLTSELFGFWQTEQYMPPIAHDGKVPRNEYGNVELFKPCMLPVGAVHLQIPGLLKVANKLDIDCVPALVGFDVHKGGVHPVFDGFVVCEEFKEILLAAWDEDQENGRKREAEKREKRVLANWKKLTKALLIRERLRLKYGSTH
ncbi:DNA repair protein complementing XP-C cells -like protein [Halotydeus destructor]|nr:DNA repair protein complementing XP-C cells -like protein [Halotydeus destructor]